MDLERYQFLKKQNFFVPYENIQHRIGNSDSDTYFTFPKGYPYEIKGLAEGAGGWHYFKLGVGSVFLTEEWDGRGWFRDSITVIEELNLYKVASEFLKIRNEMLHIKATERDRKAIQSVSDKKSCIINLKLRALKIILKTDSARAERIYNMLKNEGSSIGDILNIFGGDLGNFNKINSFIRENHGED